MASCSTPRRWPACCTTSPPTPPIARPCNGSSRASRRCTTSTSRRCGARTPSRPCPSRLAADRMRPALIASLAGLVCVSGLAAQQRAITDSDLFAFRWVASPQLAPDGRRAAYVLVTVNAKHDGYETGLWLVATDGLSPPRRITSGPHDGAPRWSPDGATLAFLRPTDGHTQLYLLSLAGGEAQQLTDLPKGAGPAAWSPDGKTIAFTSTTAPEDLVKTDKKDEPKSDVRVITEAEFRADDEGYVDPGERAHIWTVPGVLPATSRRSRIK